MDITDMDITDMDITDMDITDMDIADMPYGGRAFTCRDLEGHLWAIGTYDSWHPAT